MAERIEADARSGGWSRIIVSPTIPPRLGPSSTRDSPAQQLAGRLVAAGHECYLVGGSVRDAFLDLEPGRGRDVDIATDARPDEVERSCGPGPTRCGPRASASGPSAASKDDRHFEITTYRAEVYRPESRKPEVDVRRRHRDRPVAARLHGQRDGARAARAGARRPVRRRGRPRGAAAAHAARARGLVRRRPAAHAARGTVRRAARRSSPMPELVAAVVRAARPPRDRERRAHPRRARRSCSSSTTRRPGLWFLVETRPGRRVPARAQRDAARAGPDPHAQGRARAHDRGRAQDAPRAGRAARRAVARRRQAQDALVRRRAA